MAEVHDVDPDLRQLARRVPDLTRAALSPLELSVRCSHAARLIAEAGEAGDTVKGDRARSQAGKVLRACSPETYQVELRRLNDQAQQARQRGDNQAALVAAEEIRRLDRTHPQVPPDEVAQAVAAELSVMADRGQLEHLRIPLAPQDNAFSRRFGRIRTPRKKGR